jgi:hypothetical protein
LGILQHPVLLAFTYGKVSKDEQVRHEAINVFCPLWVETEVKKTGNEDKRRH